MKRQSILVAIVIALICFGNIKGDLSTTAYLYNDTVINHGDSYHQVWIYNNANVDMLGGHIQNGLYPQNSSIVTIYDGTINYGLISDHTSNTSVFGGDIKCIQTEGSSIISIYGGNINTHVGSYDSSVINIYGGNFAEYVYGYHASNSKINIFGYDFNYNPLNGSNNGGQLTGCWGDGSAFSIDFMDTMGHYHPYITTYNDFVELHVVPIPSAVFLGTIGLIFSGWRLLGKGLYEYDQECKD